MQAYKLGPDEPAQYALEGAIAIAGAGVSWLKDSLRIIDSPEESATLAASVDSTGGLPLHAPFVLMSLSKRLNVDLTAAQESTEKKGRNYRVQLLIGGSEFPRGISCTHLPHKSAHRWIEEGAVKVTEALE